MERLRIFFYSCVDFDLEHEKANISCGLTANTDADAVRADVHANYTDPRYINVEEVAELQPVLDQDGNVIGFAGITAEAVQEAAL